MDNPRPEKVAVVDEVRDRFDGADAAILTEYRGIDVGEMAELRGSIRAAGGDYKIFKNTLVRLAVRQLDLELEELLVGPTAIAFVPPTPEGRAGDPAAVAKALRDFAKKNEHLVVKGGVLGEKILSAADLQALADLPPREQLLAEFLGAAESMLSDFAGLLDAKLRELAYAMQELADKGGPGGEGTDDSAPPSTAVDEADASTDEADAPAGEAPTETDPPTETDDGAPTGAAETDESSEEA